MIARIDLRNPTVLFSLAVSGAILILWVIARSAAFTTQPDILGWAISFDLCITIPFAFWYFLVRPRHVSFIAIAPVILGTLFVGKSILPLGQQAMLHDFARLIEIGEVALIGWLVWRLREVSGHHRSSGADDPAARLRSVLQEAFGRSVAVDVVAGEVIAIVYALFSWRWKRTTGQNGITFYRASSWSIILSILIFLCVVEGIAVHLLVRMWSPVTAWMLTSLDLYGILWLMGDFQALRLRPTQVSADAIELRYGLRWEGSIPIDAIESVRHIGGGETESIERKDLLKVSNMDDPSYLITLREAIEFRGLMGIRRRARFVALLPDQPEILERALAAHLK